MSGAQRDTCQLMVYKCSCISFQPRSLPARWRARMLLLLLHSASISMWNFFFPYELHHRDPCLRHFPWNSGWRINTWTHAFVQDKDTQNEGGVNGRMKQRNGAIIHLVSHFPLDTFSYELIDFSYATFQFQKDALFLVDDSFTDTIQFWLIFN